MVKPQDKFQKLFVMETRARDNYAEILPDIDDKQMAERIAFIRDQEAGHMRLAQELVKMNEKAEQRKVAPRIKENTLVQLRVELKLKSDLINATIHFLAREMQIFNLLESLGSKSREFAKAEKSRRDSMNVIAHQIKTPLTTTKYISEILLTGKQKTAKEQRAMIGRVREANKSMFVLVDDLLDAIRVEEDEQGIVKEKVDFIILLKEIITEIDSLAKIKKQKIIFRPFKEEIAIKSNRNILKKIFFNLIANAVNYGKEGGVVEIQIREKDRKLLVSIADNGIGIPQKDQKNIFKKFFRASNAQLIHPQGTGLGLYIVKGMLRRLKGTISFESKEKLGTTFNISIPAV